MIDGRIITIMLLCLAPFGFSHAEEQSLGESLSNVKSLMLTYDQYAGDGRIGYWDITFTGAEIESIRAYLNLAKRPPKGLALVLSKYEGRLTTDNGRYQILVCEEKRADRPFRFVLYDGDRRHVWVLLPPYCETFGKIFDSAIKKKTDRPPDRTRKIESAP